MPVSSHKGEFIAKALESCLLEWGLRNIFTVTVDNASSNDTVMGYLKNKFLTWGVSVVRYKYLHMRCIAHILNLIVQDGLKEVSDSVKKVREYVRYIRNSPARLRKFREVANLVGIDSKACLSLDVPTRWNSTYLILKTASIYEKAFVQFDESESSFRADLKDDLLDYFDWISMKKFVELLEVFFNMTERIYGSLYVTSNSMFSEISDLLYNINDWRLSDDLYVRNMGATMKQKFDKYWGDPEKMNNLIFIASILDPREKVEYLSFSLKQMFGPDLGGSLFVVIKNNLFELFEDYVIVYGQSMEASQFAMVGKSESVSTFIISSKPVSVLKARFKKHKAKTGYGGSKKSNLEIYLNEAVLEEEGDLDLLRWWKINSERFPQLSRMAGDVLVVPISTVASESCFSTRGRVLDTFRSSLTPKIVEALICT